MEITTFEHFSMAMTGVFFKPQRRKANEGVRISNLNPETRMNSKDEFRQEGYTLDREKTVSFVLLILRGNGIISANLSTKMTKLIK